ncbi:MAG: HIT family protein [Rhodomicrobiaceae bacterium]
MTTSPSYDPENIFAKILRGDLPCHKVHEDEKTMAFMDIMPRADGHTLVIPKAPSRNILDIEPDDLQHLILVVQKIARAVKQAFDGDGATIAQFSEAAGGQEVFHTHFHVMPRHEGVELRAPGTMADNAVLAEHARKLVETLARR